MQRLNIYARLRKKLLKILKAPTYMGSYDEDGLFTNHNCDFIKDERFARAYGKFFETGSSQNWHLRWRVHLLLWCSSIAKNIVGDFVECGTYLGGGAIAVADFLQFESLDKIFYLFDTYTGLPVWDKARHDYKSNDYFKRVSETFSKYNNIKLVKGLLPHSLTQVSIDKIAFLHIDCGVPEPEILSLRALWDNVSKGGVIVLNTYAYPGFEDCKRQFDEFASQKNITILYSPTGQGVIFKT